jgi:multidrug efflux pump subunit AcrA (membrane-fusion protein)
MKKRLIPVLIAFAGCALVAYNVSAVRKASKRYPPARPAVLSSRAMVLYGKIQPEGKMVRLAVSQQGLVKALFTREGDRVWRGQKILELDDSVERTEWEVAAARLDLSVKTAENSRDQLKRGEALFRGGTLNESEYVRLKWKVEVDNAEIRLRSREADLAAVRLRERLLVAPSDGVVYKLDVRPGEALLPGEGDHIVIGSPRLELRCDAEALWINRIDSSKTCDVLNAETGDSLGAAFFKSSSAYLRPRQADTEDPQQKQSSEYQEVIFSFKPSMRNLPLGLPVMVRVRE